MGEAMIRGPVHIGTGTTIAPGTYVGPYTSIGRDCHISRCELENTIVMDRWRIEGGHRVSDSLIGPESEIKANERSLPKAYRFVLGERSQVSL